MCNYCVFGHCTLHLVPLFCVTLHFAPCTFVLCDTALCTLYLCSVWLCTLYLCSVWHCTLHPAPLLHMTWHVHWLQSHLILTQLMHTDWSLGIGCQVCLCTRAALMSVYTCTDVSIHSLCKTCICSYSRCYILYHCNCVPLAMVTHMLSLCYHLTANVLWQHHF